MYKCIIEFKRTVNDETLQKLKEVTDKAYDNRIGKLENTSNDPYVHIYEGFNEDAFMIIGIANSMLRKIDGYIDLINEWDWFFANEPREDHSVLKAFKKIIEREKNERRKKAYHI